MEGTDLPIEFIATLSQGLRALDPPDAHQGVVFTRDVRTTDAQNCNQLRQLIQPDETPAADISRNWVPLPPAEDPNKMDKCINYDLSVTIDNLPGLDPAVQVDIMDKPVPAPLVTLSWAQDAALWATALNCQMHSDPDHETPGQPAESPLLYCPPNLAASCFRQLDEMSTTIITLLREVRSPDQRELQPVTPLPLHFCTNVHMTVGQLLIHQSTITRAEWVPDKLAPVVDNH